MADNELKLEIIKKHTNISIHDIILVDQIMKCMEEWAGIISKRIDEEDEYESWDDEELPY